MTSPKSHACAFMCVRVCLGCVCACAPCLRQRPCAMLVCVCVCELIVNLPSTPFYVMRMSIECECQTYDSPLMLLMLRVYPAPWFAHCTFAISAPARNPPLSMRASCHARVCVCVLCWTLCVIFCVDALCVYLLAAVYIVASFICYMHFACEV